jgi:hypothetical protein
MILVTWEGSENRCSRCPVAAESRCRGQKVPRLCELVDSADPAYNPAYVALLRLSDLDERVPSEKVGEPDRPTLAESLKLLHRMNDCPDRLVQSDCGCAGLARCARGRGRQGMVNHLDCFGCIKANLPRASDLF